MALEPTNFAPGYLAKNDTANTGWLFYRDYFAEGSNPKDKNRALESVKEPRTIARPDSGLANAFIQLKTTYPGLLIGTGYLHESKKEGKDDKSKDENIKIGFYFDHATGMPVVPGSSVKGALRGAFPQFSDEEAAIDFDETRTEELSHLNRDIREEIKEALPLKKERALFVHCLLFLIEVERPALSFEELQAIHAFERETFESQKDWRQGKDKGDNYHGIYHRDIFFDAVPVAILNANNGGQKRLFGTDYITPHKHTPKKNEKRRPELDPFSDPTPLKFLKVMPEVVYEFRFRLQPSQVWQGEQAVDAAKKETFFKNLILLLGVGAKTNVGYGHFSDDLTVKQSQFKGAGNRIPIDPIKGSGDKGPTQEPQKPTFKTDIPKEAAPFLKKDKDFEGSIIGIDGDVVLVSFKVGSFTCKIQKKTYKVKRTDPAEALGLADAVTLKVNRDYDPLDPNGLNIAIKLKQ